MKIKMYLKSLLFVGSLFLLNSCTVEKLEVSNEEELITTVQLTFKSASAEDVVLTFEDLDGDGGNNPTINSGVFKENTDYTFTVDLLNKLEDPAESITEEVEEESDDHQFFFTSTLPNVVFGYLDKDQNNLPIGLSNSFKTASKGTGTLSVILRHLPNKLGVNVANGDITNAGGETDIEVVFNVEVN